MSNITLLNYFSVCDGCRRELHELTGKNFEQYSLSRIVPVDCGVCGVETDNWFTYYGTLELKKAIIEAYPDIHLKTATKMYRVPGEEVTEDQRRNAKRINFGILYGTGRKNHGKKH